MNKYSKTISLQNVMDIVAANREFIGFINELFERLGYNVLIRYHDDRITGDRTITAEWNPICHKKNNGGDPC